MTKRPTSATVAALGEASTRPRGGRGGGGTRTGNPRAPRGPAWSRRDPGAGINRCGAKAGAAILLNGRTALVDMELLLRRNLGGHTSSPWSPVEHESSQGENRQVREKGGRRKASRRHSLHAVCDPARVRAECHQGPE